MLIKIHSSYIAKKDSIIQLVNVFFDQGELIVKGPRNTIKTNVLDDDTVNIKYFKKPSFFKSVIYSFFRKSKAKRSFEYANYLLENKINTPFPIAFIENKNSFGLLSDSYYISKQINYDFTIRELIHNPLFPEREIILQQFAEFTFKMHEAKINFLDHSPGNTLIIKVSPEIYEFYLIDLNRMKFENLSIEDRMDNFKKMWLSKTMVSVVAKAYADLIKYPENELHEILLNKTLSFKRKITKKKYLKRRIGRK